MALKVSKMGVARLRDYAERAHARARGLAVKSEQAVGTLVRTAEVQATAFGMGVVNGRFGGVEILGVPLDLGAGSAAHLLAFVGVGGKFSSHLHNLADGALASYMTTLGVGVGKRMAQSAGASSAGAFGSGVGSAAEVLSSEDLAAMASR